MLFRSWQHVSSEGFPTPTSLASAARIFLVPRSFMRRRIPFRWLLLILGLWLVFAWAAWHLYFQLRPVPVFVGSMPPLTAREQEKLLQIPNLPPSQRAALTGVPYAEAPRKFISRWELFLARGVLAWASDGPYWVETVMIHDANHVTIRVDDSRAVWVELSKRDG